MMKFSTISLSLYLHQCEFLSSSSESSNLYNCNKCFCFSLKIFTQENTVLYEIGSTQRCKKNLHRNNLLHKFCVKKFSYRSYAPKYIYRFFIITIRLFLIIHISLLEYINFLLLLHAALIITLLNNFFFFFYLWSPYFQYSLVSTYLMNSVIY